MYELGGKIVLVTGGASGLGRACVQRFRQEGATAIAADIAQSAADRSGSSIHLDVTSEDSWRAAIVEILERFGRIDVLLNGAGIAFDGDDVLNCTAEIWRKTLSVNLDGTFLGCKLVSAAMREGGGGSIINIASVNGATGDGGIVAEGVAAYASSKAAVRMLSKSAALDLAARKTNVRCNVILPGYFATPMVLDYLASHPDGDAARARIIDAHPMGRLGQPEELAGIVMYLASDRSAAVTGGEFVVDGGYLAR
ncbi:dehydrogenase [Mesorhizobium sp. 113-3-9]|uniref:SDR family NAD(P)-dependent oxidoreductase n=1 Tax=Mesorhizobium sp. 113-3-9 TaxID=2744517 RepID=UPI001928FC12|nr:SDR family oxidoreductase [Mesorhizobium sp. 113-3-9]BCG86696.1 dehydrogenase [Mesorhizobium sp. 113-3-9]